MKPRKTIPRKPKENHVGRPKKIETPEDLLNLFYEFVEITKKKEIVKTVRFTNSDGGVSTKEEVFPQPFFLLDFTDYLGVDCRYLEKIKLRNDEFFTVVYYIKEFIAKPKNDGCNGRNVQCKHRFSTSRTCEQAGFDDEWGFFQ